MCVCVCVCVLGECVQHIIINKISVLGGRGSVYSKIIYSGSKLYGHCKNSSYFVDVLKYLLSKNF